MAKVTLAFLNKKYDELYEQASKLIKLHDPCQIRLPIGADIPSCTSCLRHEIKEFSTTLCCGPAEIGGSGDTSRCIHLGPKGCTVKSLRCKIWFCSEVKETHKLKLFGYKRVLNEEGKTIGFSSFPTLNKIHTEIMAEMDKYKFFLLFREGKEKTVRAAYNQLNK